ncbi:MAG: EAL domain-containing protein [Sulfurimonas sp.]|nr:EAL domain-containing protein [Sulfurimonas sp.]
MNLTIEQQATKEAIDCIYQNTKTGIIGHFLVLMLLAILFIDSKIPINTILFGVFTHYIILLIRMYIAFKYNKIKDKIDNFNDLYAWLVYYKIVMFLSGLAFGLMLFFVHSLPTEHHFLILAVIVGLAAGSILTIGEVFSIYISYVFTMLGFTLLWMIMQNDDVYNTGAILLALSMYYFGTSGKRYSNNFKQIIIEKNRAKEHLLAKKIAQDKIIEQESTLDYQKNYDLLTALPNRILFNDRLKQGIQKAQRNGTILALYIIDLDNFKVINDSLGHDVGDKALIAVSSRIKNVIRSNDTLSRLGGDEFSVILEDFNYIQGTSRLAQNILKILSKPFVINKHTFYISCSIGIGLYPKDATDSFALIKDADSAMYKAKEEGKNNFQFYSNEMTKLVLERVVMEAAIHEAIKIEEFVVFYQPQIDARSNKLIGMEALVRWESPKFGLVLPFKFIPLAEELGLIVEIDNLVMNIAMKQFSQWYKDGYNPGVLSLNLAIKNLEQEDYIKKLNDNIMKFSLDSQHIELELTESDIMKKPEKSIDKLEKISALDIKIAIDDFGTGYSSLSYLKKFPINKLKIDKSFIDDIPNDEDSKAIVRAIIAMANSLKLDVIAEGVEEEIQRDFLLENGCHKIQGYYYAKPLPAKEMQKFMENRNINAKTV